MAEQDVEWTNQEIEARAVFESRGVDMSDAGNRALSGFEQLLRLVGPVVIRDQVSNADPDAALRVSGETAPLKCGRCGHEIGEVALGVPGQEPPIANCVICGSMVHHPRQETEAKPKRSRRRR